MKIALIGNCQIESIADCVRMTVEDAHIEMIHSWNLVEKFGNLEIMASELRNYDVILAHRFYDNPIINFDDFMKLGKVIEFPVINFGAFHPDCNYLVDSESKKIVRTAVGDYNSGLVAYCYSRGFSQSKCEAAFRDDVFEYIGYLDSWGASYRALDAEFQRCGLSASHFVPNWIRQRPFMHSINHPHLFAIKDVLVALLRIHEKRHIDVPNIEQLISDPLIKYSIWPIYPPIASLYGVEGHYIFKAGSGIQENWKIFRLLDFINDSYDRYANEGVKDFASDLMVTWDSIGLREFISDMRQ